MKKIIITSLVCATLFSTANINYIEAEDLESKLQANEQKQEELDEQIINLDKKISDVETKIEETNQKIDEINEQSEKLIREIEELEENIKENEEYLGERLKVINNNYTLSYLKVILSSDSISGFLNNIYVVQEIVEQDKEMLENLEKDKTEIEDKKQALDKNKEEEKLVKEELEKTKKSLDEDKEEVDKLKQELEKEEEELQLQLQEISSKSIPSSDNSSSSNNIVSNGSWPVPGYNRISSYYGNRLHPVLGVQKMHTGIDIPAPQGTPVVSIDSGTVIYSGVQGSYGNTVMIQHSNGRVTLYAHNSSLNVRVGQSVKKGQMIAKIGSTGRSTGPHLHFEIRINGSAKNPLDYL